MYNYKNDEAKLKSVLLGGTAQLRTQSAFNLCTDYANKGDAIFIELIKQGKATATLFFYFSNKKRQQMKKQMEPTNKAIVQPGIMHIKAWQSIKSKYNTIVHRPAKNWILLLIMMH